MPKGHIIWEVSIMAVVFVRFTIYPNTQPIERLNDVDEDENANELRSFEGSKSTKKSWTHGQLMSALRLL